MKKTSTLSAILIALAASTASQASINFVFDYSDPSNGSLWTQARKDSLNRAAGVVEGYFANYTATINIEVKSENNPASNTLASAASHPTTASNTFTPGFGTSETVQAKIITGTDGNGAAADGLVNVNWAVPGGWDLSPTSAGVSATAFDFESTMIHEIFHAVGFKSSIGQNGTDAFGQGAGTPGDWDPFDQWVGNSSGLLINQTTFANDAAAYTASLTGGAGTGGLGFWGPNAMAANGGQPVWLYTPTTFEGGSSGSHLDDEFAPYNFIMEASTNMGPGVRELSPQEIGMLRDMGYAQVVPEPSTGLFGMIGMALLALRRRR